MIFFCREKRAQKNSNWEAPARVIEKFGLVDLTMFLAKFAATEIKCRQNDNRRVVVFGGPTDDLDIINNET